MTHCDLICFVRGNEVDLVDTLIPEVFEDKDEASARFLGLAKSFDFPRPLYIQHVASPL